MKDKLLQVKEEINKITEQIIDLFWDMQFEINKLDNEAFAKCFDYDIADEKIKICELVKELNIDIDDEIERKQGVKNEN